LRVIGRSSARALVGRGLNAQAIGRELHAGTVLQGSVQRSSDRLRINVSLVSTSDGSVVWSEKYDREIRDVFAVQDEIARSVAGQLRVTLAGGSAATLVRRETDDPEAHALYLQGLFAWNRRTAPMVRKAIELFEQAARRDPNYARPHAGIAMAYIVLPVYDDVPNRETISKALDAARRALSLDSLLPEAHATIGLANAYYYNNSEAERSFAKALALDSSFATAHFWRAILLGQVGRLEDAIRETQRAFELEPTSLVMQTNVASALANARRYAAADSVYRSILALDPTFHLGMLFRARSLIDQRQLGEAIALLEALAAQPNLRKSEKLGLLAYAYAMAGQKAQARAALARLPDDTLVSVSGAVAAALDALGDRDAAVAMFKRAVAQHDQWITIVGRGAHFDALRKDLRLTAVFARIESP
jgi:tetratricopeptide (TPR) repeat protein